MENEEYKPMATHPLREDGAFEEPLSSISDGSYRTVPRDGNCLYHAVAILLYPSLAENPQKLKRLESLFKAADVSSVVYETYLESIEECFSEGVNCSTEAGLLFVGMLRLAVSSYIKTNKAEYSAFFLEEEDIETYLRLHVDPMGERAGEIEIQTICKIFEVSLEVIQILSTGCTRLVYGGSGVKHYLLHTPDHFEPYYPPDKN